MFRVFTKNITMLKRHFKNKLHNKIYYKDDNKELEKSEEIFIPEDVRLQFRNYVNVIKEENIKQNKLSMREVLDSMIKNYNQNIE